ncbi:MAG: hypothetical protein KAT15_12300, partial [Bacteroidales bacterium]|nr:hypothetical protein [Bacteroidales bacterium]
MQDIIEDDEYLLSGEFLDVSSHHPLLFPEIPYLPSHYALSLNDQEIKEMDLPARKQLKELMENQIPLILQGGESELYKLLDLPSNPENTGERTELMAVYCNPNGNYSYLFVSTALKKQEISFTVGEKDNSHLQVPDEDPDASLYEDDPAHRYKAQLYLAKKWVAEKYYAESMATSSKADVAGDGIWNAISDYTWTDVAYNSSNDRIAVYTLQLNAFKIRDLKPERDFYLIQSMTHHEANVDVSYQQNFTLIGTGYIGWFVSKRNYSIYGGTSTALLDYEPEGTIGGGSHTLSVGGGLSADLDGPGASIEAGYSKSVNYMDVTVTDESSMNDEKAGWEEAFVCPATPSDYQWWPIWSPPTAASKGIFKSEPIAIYSTTDRANGVDLNLTFTGDVIRDKVTGYLVYAEISRTWYDMYISRYINIVYNYPPSKPDMPSGLEQVWVNDTTLYTVLAEDQDADPLEYGFEWGDLTPLVYGESEQLHSWTEGGHYGVRAKARDMPHGGVSPWSSSFSVFVKAMTRLEIEGPEEVTRNNPGLFNCVVHYNDATTDNANPEWSIVEGEEYAEISQDGQLTGIGSDIDETIILQAKYTDHYITDSSRLSVRVVMAPTNISETSLENEFRIFPNPASGSLQISYYVENPGTLMLNIYDQQGSLV